MSDKQRIFFIAKTLNNHNSSHKSYQNSSKEWTEDQDNLLINLAKSLHLRKKWIFLEKYFPGRSSADLYFRYLKINPQIKKGKWTEQENDKLKNLVSQFGFNWAFIAKIMRNRNCKQIRSHYENYLRDNLLNKNFTEQEDDKLIKFHKFLGNKWSKYLEFFSDRSAKMIENRVNALKKKFNKEETCDNLNVSTKITHCSMSSNFYKLNLSIDETDYVSVFVFM